MSKTRVKNMDDMLNMPTADDGNAAGASTISKTDDGNVAGASSAPSKTDQEIIEKELIPPINEGTAKNVQAVPMVPDISSGDQAIHDQTMAKNTQSLDQGIVDHPAISRNRPENFELIEVLQPATDVLVIQQSELPAHRKYSCWERIKLQRKPWINYLHQYYLQFIICAVLIIIAVIIFTESFFLPQKRLQYHKVTVTILVFNFLYIWLCTVEAPPFKSTVDGTPLEAKYGPKIIEV